MTVFDISKKDQIQEIYSLGEVSRGKIIDQTYGLLFLDWIKCVRWSPSGDKLASSSEDQTVKLLDFKTGKVLYTGNTSDGRNYKF